MTPIVPIPLTSLLPFTMDGTRIVVYCKFKDSSTYMEFQGTEVSKLPMEMLNSLALEHATCRLEYTAGGIFPVLVYYFSDQVKIVNYGGIADILKNFNNKEKEGNEADDSQ